MATRRFGATPGDEIAEVTEAVGAAVAAKLVEVTVDVAPTTMAGGTRGITRDETIQQLMIVIDYIQTRPWPPA